MGLKNTPAYAESTVVTNLSRDEAWQIISSTNALNRDMGLPRINYSEPSEKSGTILRRAEAEIAFMTLRWDEYPFEWVQPEWHGVIREFIGGPIYKIFAGVSLSGGENGAPTTVKVLTYVSSRSLLTKPLALILAKMAVKRASNYFENVFRHAQAAFNITRVKKVESKADHQKLTTKMRDLLNDKRSRQDIAKVLESHLRHAPDDEVLMMQPYKLADAWGQDRIAVLKVFLSATKVGILELQWALTCPACKIPKQSSKSMSGIQSHFDCDFCDIKYESSLDDSLELRFSVHENIRKAQKGEFCIGSPAQFPHIISQIVVPPKASKNVLISGDYEHINIRRLRRKMQVTLKQPASGQSSTNSVEVAIGTSYLQTSSQFFDGKTPLSLSLKNNSEESALLSVEHDLSVNYAVTALKLMTIPQFMQDFANEVVANGTALSVKQICLLFTDIKGSTQTYELLGDAKAFSAIAKHFDFLYEVIARHDGAIVKTIGDAIMAVFIDPRQAIAAVVEFQERLPQLNLQNRFEFPLILKAGVHMGPAIAINANGISDFFGKTVNFAVRLQEASRGSDCVLSHAVTEELMTSGGLGSQAFTLQAEEIAAKGFAGTFAIQRMVFTDRTVEKSA